MLLVPLGLTRREHPKIVSMGTRITSIKQFDRESHPVESHWLPKGMVTLRFDWFVPSKRML
jgi:hypothetical protein